MMSRLVKMFLVAALAVVASSPMAATNNEYKTLRLWALGESGLPSARWGDIDCGVWKKDVLAKCKHTGVDYGTGQKEIKVYSVGSGTVTGVGGATGKVCIYNKKRDVTLCYLHLSQISVKTNDTVKLGQKIGLTGKVGASAIHLHLEARSGSRASAAADYANTIDPYTNAKALR